MYHEQILIMWYRQLVSIERWVRWQWQRSVYFLFRSLHLISFYLHWLWDVVWMLICYSVSGSYILFSYLLDDSSGKAKPQHELPVIKHKTVAIFFMVEKVYLLLDWWRRKWRWTAISAMFVTRNSVLHTFYWRLVHGRDLYLVKPTLGLL